MVREMVLMGQSRGLGWGAAAHPVRGLSDRENGSKISRVLIIYIYVMKAIGRPGAHKTFRA